MSFPLDAEQFGEALNSEKGLPHILSAVGVVQKTSDPSVIEFSPSHGHALCVHWVKIPLRMIAKVEVLGKRKCHDHLHDYVILYFKLAETHEAAVFAELYQHEVSARGSALTPVADAIGGETFDATTFAAVDCVVVRIYSFVGGGLIHAERCTQPDLFRKVQNVLKAWGARPYGQNRPEISNC